MKLLLLTSVYPQYVRDFYAVHPELSSGSYSLQREAIDFDAYSWNGVWGHWLKPHGYQVDEVILNMEPLQRAWARENDVPDWQRVGLEQVAIAQIKSSKPDILWCEVLDEGFLKRVLSETPSIKLVLGWVGSAIPRTDVWRHMHLVLSCAAESVEYFERHGIRSLHFDHAFDPRINERLGRLARTLMRHS